MCLGDYALTANEYGDHATALRHAQEGLAISEELNYSDLMSYNLYCLGAAMCNLSDLAASHLYLLRSLQISNKAQILDNMAAALYYVAQLRIQESKMLALSAPARLEKQTEALELLALIIHSRATWQLFRDRAIQLQAQLVEGLPVEIAIVAIERSKARSIAQVVAEILCDDPESIGKHSEPLP